MPRKRNTVPKEPVSVSIPIDILSQIQEIAYKEGKSMSGLICEIVSEEINRR